MAQPTTTQPDAIDEMRERVEVLRNRAEHNRNIALESERDRNRSNAAADRCDELADQYAALIAAHQ